MTSTKVLGTKGEIVARQFLKRNGYKILEQNYKNFVGEIDLICHDKKTNETIFVEVKTRSSLAFGVPALAVDHKKQNKIKNCATVYIKSKKLWNTKIRFDVVEILDESVNHIKYAF